MTTAKTIVLICSKIIQCPIKQNSKTMMQTRHRLNKIILAKLKNKRINQSQIHNKINQFLQKKKKV